MYFQIRPRPHPQSLSLTYLGIRHDDHDVGVISEGVDKSCEVRVAHLHAVELCLQLAATQLELLDNVADLLKAVHVSVGSPN